VANDPEMLVKVKHMTAVVQASLPYLKRWLGVRDARLDALEAQVKELQQRPALRYMGTYAENLRYTAGTLVTRSGSLWLAETDTDATPGSGASGWKLIVKRGQA
jgi:hypothetical protein